MASVEERAVVCCFMADQAASAENRKNANPEMLQQFRSSDAQSASVKAQSLGTMTEAGRPTGVWVKLYSRPYMADQATSAENRKNANLEMLRQSHSSDTQLASMKAQLLETMTEAGGPTGVWVKLYSRP